MKHLLSTIALFLAVPSPILLQAQDKVFTQPEPLTDTTVQEVKQQIIDIARRNNERTSNAASVRRRLEPLISLLVASVPRRSEAEKLPLVVGAWQELWTDGASQIYVGPTPGSFDLAQIYQVVTPNNYYYNIGRYHRPGMEDLTVFLRGEYSVEPTSLQVNFTKYVFGVGWLYENSNFLEQAFRAETGIFDRQHFEPTLGFNPVGLPQLALANLYVDNDFRILQAGGGEQSSIFVLVRVGSRR